MMRDFDSIMIPLQLNLTSQGCIDKDVSPLSASEPMQPFQTHPVMRPMTIAAGALSKITLHRSPQCVMHQPGVMCGGVHVVLSLSANS